VPIWDDNHGREHIPKLAGRQCSEDAVQAHEWGDTMLARLFRGDVDWAMEGLETLPPCDDHTVEAIRQLIGFLRNHAQRLHDPPARTGGYPLRSGDLESANKRIRHVRLKRSGAGWYLEQANHRRALRWAIDNGPFERIFEADKRRALQKHGGDLP
jgi:hypothetical protein